MDRYSDGSPDPVGRPKCGFEDPVDDDHLAAPPVVGKVECDTENFALPDADELVDGTADVGVYYPFEIEPGHADPSDINYFTVSQVGTLDHYQVNRGNDGYGELSRAADGDYRYAAILVRAGVSRPYDSAGASPRLMNRFSFVVDERVFVGSNTFNSLGSDAEKRYGVPKSPKYRSQYFREWPNAPINPNRAYLMVATYYESHRSEFDKNHRSFVVTDQNFSLLADPTSPDPRLVNIADVTVKVPERHIRRVICRMLVYPAGFSPASNEGKSIWSKLVDNVKGGMGTLFGHLKGFFNSILSAVAKIPAWMTGKSVNVVCDGVVATEDLTSDDRAKKAGEDGAVTMDDSGRLVRNSAGVHRQEALDECERASSNESPRCHDAADLIVEGACVELPAMVLKPNKAETKFFPPTGVIAWPAENPEEEAEYFLPVDSLRVDPSRYEVGLTEVRLDFDFKWASVNTGVYNGVDGYLLEVTPDWRAAESLRKAGFNYTGDPIIWALPKRVYEYAESSEPLDPDEYRGQAEHMLTGFYVGALNQRGAGHQALVHPYPTFQLLYIGDPDKYWPIFTAVGGARADSHFDQANTLLGRLPLAPGFKHTFRIAPYVVIPGTDQVEPGEFSDPLVLDGNRTACWDPGLHEDYKSLYGCPTPDPSPIEFEEEDYRIGLLGLAGSNVCGDIFSATPPRFTWDNDVVRRVWSLMWILAGSVLFILLVWQAFRMTYDIWIDPRPAVGLRELVPRFLLAAAMAAGSFYICKWALVLGNDITCFVAHTTGMTMWGVIGQTFLAVAQGFFDLYTIWFSMALLMPVVLIFNLVVVGLIVQFIMFILLYLFIKVALHMLMRIALLAVLVAFSPLAFAFYASDNTSHWTKKWVSLFLGALFQQVVVLVVIYIGGHLIGEYVGQGRDSLFTFIVGCIFGILTLALADKVPDIVNPSGKGLFGAFGDMAKMALAATVMVASAGAGAAMGAAGVLGGAGGGAAGGAGGGGSGVGGAPGVAGGSMGGSAGSGGAGSTTGASAGASGGGTASPYSGLRSSAGTQQGPQPGLGARMMTGFNQGVQWGGRTNSRIADGLQGRFLYRNSSTRDDSADKMDDLTDMLRQQRSP